MKIQTSALRIWPTLYKLDSKGKVREWSIAAYEDFRTLGMPTKDYGGKASAYEQIHGVHGGKLQHTSTVISMGKNVGKANETTAWEQCLLEAESIWTKKRDRDGYSEQIPTDKPFRPMLAKKFKDDGKHIVFPCFVQPKLNGLRCLAIVKGGTVKLVSRKNTEWKALQHLEDELSDFPDGVYDGELYIHGPDFRKIVGAVKRDESNDLSAKIEFHVYDMVDESADFADRVATLADILPDGRMFVRFVETKTLTVSIGLEAVHDHYVKYGYEGIMLRNKKGGYKINGRSKDLQKYKAFDDDEFEIIDADENIGKLTGTCTFRCITKAGHEFNVMPEGDFQTRSQYWTDWKCGKIKKGSLLTIRFFGYTTTDKPVPNFPIGITIRDYEN